MLVQEFEGKSEKDAIKTALDTLNLTEEQVKIETVDTGKVGFFGFRTKRPVKIKVFYEESETISDFSKYAMGYLDGLFSAMNLSANVSVVQEDDEKLFLTISSPESGLLIGKKGKNLEAIQFLVNMSLNKEKGENKSWKKVILDIEGYWSRKEESIRRLALKSADIVRNSKRSRLLQAMNPFERRLVHLTLQDYNDIGTRSEGDGTYKKVRIFLK